MDGRIIISTGRSGSTLLSRMLAENRHLLVLSEFFATMDNGRRFPAGDVDGTGFAGILSADDDLSALVAARGRASPEALFTGKGSDRTATGRSPSLVRATFPSLTDQPEELFAEMIALVRGWPSRPIRNQYLVLFDWLCERLGKKAWVERSGFGIRVFEGLRATFPDARYFHIHRDGLEAALSMYDHPWFRVGVYFDFFPPTVEEAKEAILNLSGGEDVVSRLFTNPPPIEIYGHHWSNLLARAFANITLLDRAQYCDMRFERLVTNTKAALDNLATFFDLPDDPGWTERAARLVNADISPRAGRLDPEERRKLEIACAPGQNLIGRGSPGRLDNSLAILREAHWAITLERRSVDA